MKLSGDSGASLYKKTTPSTLAWGVGDFTTGVGESGIQRWASGISPLTGKRLERLLYMPGSAIALDTCHTQERSVCRALHLTP